MSPGVYWYTGTYVHVQTWSPWNSVVIKCMHKQYVSGALSPPSWLEARVMTTLMTDCTCDGQAITTGILTDNDRYNLDTIPFVIICTGYLSMEYHLTTIVTLLFLLGGGTTTLAGEWE